MIFSDQVESLTGITISASGTNPTNDQLTQYLKDGVIDVTAKWLVGHPQDSEDFQIASSEQTSNDSYSPKGTIVSVVRESGTNNDWRPCRKIFLAQQSVVLDTESLSFSSKYNPTYMVEDNGKISVFPIAATGGADSFKVYYINNDPKNNTDNAELVHSMADIRFFPTDKVHLVSLYAAVKAINNNMAGIIADLSSFSITTVPPDFADVYNEAEQGITIDDEITQMLAFIETNEDVELANAKAAEIGLRFKRATDEFQSGLGKYSAEIQGYAQEVAAEVSEQGQKVQTESAKYQWLQDRAAALQAEYMGAFATPQPAGEGR